MTTNIEAFVRWLDRPVMLSTKPGEFCDVCIRNVVLLGSTALLDCEQLGGGSEGPAPRYLLNAEEVRAITTEEDMASVPSLRVDLIVPCGEELERCSKSADSGASTTAAQIVRLVRDRYKLSADSNVFMERGSAAIKASAATSPEGPSAFLQAITPDKAASNTCREIGTVDHSAGSDATIP